MGRFQDYFRGIFKGRKQKKKRLPVIGVSWASRLLLLLDDEGF